MLKSYSQQRIEEQNDGREFKDVLIEALKSHQGTGAELLYYMAIHFYVSDGTIRNWCRDLGIDLADYR